MSSGALKRVTGAVRGTGANLDVTTVGFRPRRVMLENVSGLCRGVWQDTMADASVVKTITDGTMSVPTTNGVTPLANGFRLGADADLNVSGELVHFIAEE